MTYDDQTSHQFQFQLDEFYLDLQQDGSKISILDEEIIVKRPYPGLRPFRTSECQLFKGRGGQEEELIKRLKKNHFLAVIGSSGTGKSSLVRAGLIPQLFGGYLHDAGNKWNIAICRPGKDPIANLAIAISSVITRSKEKQEIAKHFEEVESTLNTSIYGLLDINELLNSIDNSESNLLVIVDQFEELFRFDRKSLGKDNLENHFVNLLLKAALNASGRVYVIITMRSEFLGDCVKYRGLPEAINDGQYLVPQLNRNQLIEAIEEPIKMGNRTIDHGLVELLINEINESKLKENLDQLPILQHALMRTYGKAIEQGTDTIGVTQYEATGGMNMALANHAELKYHDLGDNSDNTAPSKKQKIAKLIFQALTDLSTDQKGGRRPTELKKLYGIAKSINASQHEVDEVIEHFRDSDTSFIMPPKGTSLYPELILDISHESLMRNWERLNNWISEEVKSGKLYKTLNDRRELSQQNGMQEEWLRGGLLEEMLNWEQTYPINAAWASRYHSKADLERNNETDEQAYNQNLDFLRRSQEHLQLEKEKEEKRKRTIILIYAIAAFVAVVFGVVALGEAHFANVQKKKAEIEKDSVAKMAREIEKNKEKMKTADLNTINALMSAKKADSMKNAALIRANKAIKLSVVAARQAEARAVESRAAREKANSLEQLNARLAVSEREARRYAYFYKLTKKTWWDSDLDSNLNTRLADTLFNLRFPERGRKKDSLTADRIERSLQIIEKANESKENFPVYSYLLSEARDTSNNIITNYYVDSISKNTIPYQNKIALQPAGPGNVNTSYNKLILKFVPQSSTQFIAGNSNGFFKYDVAVNKPLDKVLGLDSTEIAVSIADDANKFLTYNLKNNSFIVYSVTNGDVKERYGIESIGKGEPDFYKKATANIKGTFSHNGRFVALYDGHDAYELFDLEEQKRSKIIRCKNPVKDFDFSRNGSKILMFDDSSAYVADYAHLDKLNFKKIKIDLKSYSAPDHLIKGSFDVNSDTSVTILGSIYKYTGNINKPLEHHYHYDHYISDYFHTSVKGYDIIAKVWEYKQPEITATIGQQEKKFPWHKSAVTDLQVSNDGSTIISSDSANVYIWTPDKDLKGADLKKYATHNELASYWFNLGDSYHNEHKYDLANDCLNKALFFDPHRAEAWYKLGLISNENKNYDLANKQFEKAVNIEGGNIVYLTALGSSYFYNKVISYSKGDSILNIALKLNRNNANTWNESGILSYTKGDYKEAIEKYKRAVAIDSTNITYLTNIADAYYKLRDFKAGDRYYKKGLELDSAEASTWNKWAINLDNAGKYKESLEKYQKAISLDSTNIDYFTNIADTYYELKEPSIGSDYYKKSLKLDSVRARTWNSWGVSLYNADNFKDAVEKYKKAVTLDSTTAVYLANLAAAYYKTRQPLVGDIYYTKSVNIDSANPSTWNRWGISLYNVGYYKQAVEKYKRAVAVDSTNTTYLTNLGQAYYKVQEPREGDIYYTKSVNVDSVKAGTWNEWGVSLDHIDNFEQAVHKYKKAISIDNTEAVYFSNLIRLYYRFKQYRSGDSLLAIALKVDTGSVDLWSIAANRSRKQAKYSLALQQIQKEITIDTTAYDPYIDLAVTNLEQGQPKSALSKYKQAFGKTQKDNWVFYNDLGSIAIRLEDYSTAKRYTDTAILLAPIEANPYAHRGYANLKTGNLSLCKIDLDKALNLNPGYIKTYFYYACYYGVNNDPENALKYLKVAIDKGFDEVYWITNESSLSIIRNDERYKHLVAQLKSQLE